MKNVSTDTIVRTLVLALALLNQIFSACGIAILPITNEQIEILVTTGITICASIWAWWKNNSFTSQAIAADNLMKSLKEKAKENENQ